MTNNIKKFLFALSIAMVYASAAIAQDGAGSVTVDNGYRYSVVTDSTFEYAENLYIGPSAVWEIHGILMVYGKNIWIAPTAQISGTGRIVFADPSANPFYPDMMPGPTTIDGNNGNFIGVELVHANPGNILLDDIADPGYGTLNPPGALAAALKIGHSFVFDVDQGDVMLQGHDFVLNSEATLAGYRPQRMIVTGNSIDGHVVRQEYTGPFVFPVGIAEGDYTPVSVDNTVDNTIHVSVQDYAGSGSIETDTDKGVDRTWNIYAGVAAGNSCIDLQHNTATNGSQFTAGSHYVTRYGISPNNTGDEAGSTAWQVNTAGAGTATGSLTTGGSIADASERSRCYTDLATDPLANMAYFTKSSAGELCLQIRVYLEGSLINNGGQVSSDGRPLMRDDLRHSPFTGQNYIPKEDPYQTPSAYVDMTGHYSMQLPGSGAAYQSVTDSAAVFGVSGEDAIVDWVYVELRSKTDSTEVVATRSGLLQRDGDVVDVDGVSCLKFPGVLPDAYYVAVRHRNHLGAMTATAQTVAALSGVLDLTSLSTSLYDFGTSKPGFDYTGLAANENVISGYRALWAGNFNADNKIKYESPADDQDILLGEVIFYPDNTDLLSNYNGAFGYLQGDYDMNSRSKYEAPNDDHDLLLGQLVFYPLNTLLITIYNNFIEQIPN